MGAPPPWGTDSVTPESLGSTQKLMLPDSIARSRTYGMPACDKPALSASMAWASAWRCATVFCEVAIWICDVRLS